MIAPAEQRGIYLAAMKSNFSTIRDHLLNDYYLPIRDPLWGHVYLSEAFRKIIQTREFQQLSRIKQLGPSYLVYPGATHSRLSHSLGVFHIASRLIQHFIRRNKTIPITLEGTKAFLAAALLHDLGHFPFTHSLKELSLKPHEQLTSEIILSSPIKDILKKEMRVDPRLCAAIIDEQQIIDQNMDIDQINFFRKILSGPIDPDKLDYLNRDAYFCGIPYGFQDVDYILSVLEPDPMHGFVIERDSLSVIEGLLFSKYLMYRAVYWHRSVRTATGMIKKALYCALREGEIQSEELYGLDDDSFYLNFGNKHNTALSLIRAVYNRELFSTIITLDFDADNPAHSALEDLAERSKTEDSIRASLEESLGMSIMDSEIIVDIPENISFEADIMIRDGEKIEKYASTPSVFTSEVIDQFIRSLRKIRVAVSGKIAEKIHNPSLIQQRIFQALDTLQG